MTKQGSYNVITQIRSQKLRELYWRCPQELKVVGISCSKLGYLARTRLLSEVCGYAMPAHQVSNLPPKSACHEVLTEVAAVIK